MSTETLTDWLLRQVAEREAMYDVPEFVLIDSAHGTGWGTRGDCTICDAYMPQGNEPVTEDGYIDHLEFAHQRALVLAECEAKRRIVAEHRHVENLIDTLTQADQPDVDEWEARSRALEGVVRLLALPFADRPGYLAEWAPR